MNPGQKLQVFAFKGRIELVPERWVEEMRGVLKGVDYSNFRDRKDRY